MLKLPADHPQNWFRNAFIHVLDCPHGNWWFYVWHRGYLGYFEQTIRNLSGDDTFAMPYWDWTTLPQIPDSMFDGVLTPSRCEAFEPYTSNLALFIVVAPARADVLLGRASHSEQRAAVERTRLYRVRQCVERRDGFYRIRIRPILTVFLATWRMPTPAVPAFSLATILNWTRRRPTTFRLFVVYSGLLPTDFYNPAEPTELQ